MSEAMQQLAEGLDAAPSAADHDFHQWAIEQAQLLRSGSFGRLDLARLAEEIEDVGRSEYNALESDLMVLLQHILKWDHQPARRSRSWQLTIREHRRRIDRRLNANPSLMPRLSSAIAEAYRDGRDRALAETGLPDASIGEVCRYSLDDIISREMDIDQEGSAL